MDGLDKEEQKGFLSEVYRVPKNSTCWSKRQLCFCCCLSSVAVVVLVIGSVLLYIFLQPDRSLNSAAWDATLNIGTNITSDISMNGSFVLVSYDENFDDYLVSIGVPWYVRPVVLGG